MRIHNTGNRFNGGWDLAGVDEMIEIYEWLERPTAYAIKVATVLGLIPLRHSGIWGAADEAVLNDYRKIRKNRKK